MGRWWPTEKSVYGPGGTVAFTDGQIVERSADGQRAVWGTVTRWEPPAALSFTWHPGREPLDDAAGEGMTILRLPGAGQLERAVRLATEDDRSVAGGFLAVAVRPWQVMVHAPTLTSWSPEIVTKL